jgi:hypothetical protein
MFAFSAAKNMRMFHLDFETAFLNGDLSEEIYMKQPEGYIKPGEEDLVCKLKRAIYGLKQASRAWNRKLDKALRDLGYSRSPSDHSLYVKHTENGMLMILCYVDDLMIATSDLAEYENLKGELMKRFKIKDLGELQHCIGLEISNLSDRIEISQASYIRDVLLRYGMMDCKPAYTPLATGAVENLSVADRTTTEELKREYMSILGSVMYCMTGTRPDIAFAVSFLGRFASSPGKQHLEALKRLLRYLRATMDMKLTYYKGIADGDVILGFSDTDWAGDHADRKSTGGIVFFMSGGPIYWRSYKQTTVALSSTEAEYVTLAEAAKQAIWFRQIAEFCGLDVSNPTQLFEDNQSAIKICNNPVGHQRTKHIAVKYHFIRDEIEDQRSISVSYCPSDMMLADQLTKALARDRHNMLTEALVGADQDYWMRLNKFVR